MSEVTSLQKFQEEENKKLKQISDMQGVDLGVARQMLDESRNPTFPSNIDQPTPTYDDLRFQMLLADRAREQQRQANTQQRQVSRPDFLAQARQEVRPQFDRAVGQLTQQVEGTRRQLPQQLASRGQALGGLRGQQEDTLTRDLAYGTADLQAQGEMTALQRADVLGQRYTEEQRYQDELNFRERSFAEQQQMNQFSMQTTMQQLANDQERFQYQQARDSIGDEWKKIEFDENVRRSGFQEALQMAQFGLQERQFGLQAQESALRQQQTRQQMAQASAQIEQGATPQQEAKQFEGNVRAYMETGDMASALAYMNNLGQQGLISPQGLNYLKALVGTTTRSETTPAVGGRTTISGVGTVNYSGTPRTTTTENIITPQVEPPVDTDAELSDLYINIQSYVNGQDYESARRVLDGNMENIIATWGYPEWVRLRKAAGLE